MCFLSVQRGDYKKTEKISNEASLLKIDELSRSAKRQVTVERLMKSLALSETAVQRGYR